MIHFDLNRGKSILAVEKAMMSDQRLFLVAQRDVEDEEPDFDGVYHMGCLAQIRQVTRLPENVVRVLVEGQERGRLTGFAEEGRSFWEKWSRWMIPPILRIPGRMRLLRPEPGLRRRP